MLALLLILTTAAFVAAMVLYGVLIARNKKPVSFFDLPNLGREGSSLAWWAYRLWVAAIVAAVIFGIVQVIRLLR